MRFGVSLSLWRCACACAWSIWKVSLAVYGCIYVVRMHGKWENGVRRGGVEVARCCRAVHVSTRIRTHTSVVISLFAHRTSSTPRRFHLYHGPKCDLNYYLCEIYSASCVRACYVCGALMHTRDTGKLFQCWGWLAGGLRVHEYDGCKVTYLIRLYCVV